MKDKNKLGNIYDMSIIYDKLDIYLINRKIEYTSDKDFKMWLLDEWKEKDILISYYKNVEYNELPFHHEKLLLIMNILLFLTISSQLYSNKFFRYYMLLSILISYIYILKKLKY